MVTVIDVPFLTDVTCLAASAFSVFSPTSMLPVNSVLPHSLTTFAEISASLMIVVSCWQGLIPVQFLARLGSTRRSQSFFKSHEAPTLSYLEIQHLGVIQPRPELPELPRAHLPVTAEPHYIRMIWKTYWFTEGCPARNKERIKLENKE